MSNRFMLRFSAPEWMIIGLTLFITFASISLSLYKGIHLEAKGYLLPVAIGLGFIAFGQVYRIFRPDERIALPCTVLGLFFIYNLFMCLFSNVITPGFQAPLDPFLERFDQSIGFVWKDFVHFIIQRPLLSLFLQYVYHSVLVQMIILMIVLGFARQHKSLMGFLLTVIISSLMTITLWYFFPTLGYAVLYFQQNTLPTPLPLILNENHAIAVLQWFSEGIHTLSATDMKGLVAFPSFHIVMQMTTLWSVRRISWLFYPFLFCTFWMFPATVSHGSHYLLDLVGGIIVFIGSAWLADLLLKKISPHLENHPSLSLFGK